MNVLISMMDPAERPDCLESSLARGGSKRTGRLTDFRKSRSRSRRSQHIAFFGLYEYPKLRSRARQSAFFEPLNIFVSSNIALSLETSSKFRRFIFLEGGATCPLEMRVGAMTLVFVCGQGEGFQH